MPIKRRSFIAGAATMVMLPRNLFAQAAYPSKPIRILVGAAPGGGTDVSARIAAELLGKELGQSVVVENRPGGSSAIAMEYVAKSPTDGYTLILSNADGATILPAVKASVPYSIPESFTFIGRVLEAPAVLAVTSSSPFKNVADLVAFAKQNPGKVNCGTTGVGSASDLAAALMESAAGIKLNRISYKGSAPVLVDLLGGQLHMSLPTLSGALPYVKDGKLRILAVTSDQRDPALPDVPTTTEVGLPKFKVNLWFGIMGPANLPAAIKDRLEQSLLKVLRTDEARRLYKDAGYEVGPMPGKEFEQAVVAEAKVWKELAKAQNIVIKE